MLSALRKCLPSPHLQPGLYGDPFTRRSRRGPETPEPTVQERRQSGRARRGRIAKAPWRSWPDSSHRSEGPRPAAPGGFPASRKDRPRTREGGRAPCSPPPARWAPPPPRARCRSRQGEAPRAGPGAHRAGTRRGPLPHRSSSRTSRSSRLLEADCRLPCALSRPQRETESMTAAGTDRSSRETSRDVRDSEENAVLN